MATPEAGQARKRCAESEVLPSKKKRLRDRVMWLPDRLSRCHTNASGPTPYRVVKSIAAVLSPNFSIWTPYRSVRPNIRFESGVRSGYRV